MPTTECRFSGESYQNVYFDANHAYYTDSNYNNPGDASADTFNNTQELMGISPYYGPHNGIGSLGFVNCGFGQSC